MKTAYPGGDALLKDLGRQFENVMVTWSKEWVREATTYALRQEHLDTTELSYLFWVLLGDSDHWPRMPDMDTKMLKTVRQMVLETGQAPRYQDTIDVPSDAMEAAIDRIVRHMGQWSRSMLMVNVYTEWLNILKSLAPQVPKVTQGEVPPGNSMSWLHLSFRYLLSMRQAWFRFPLLLLNMIKLFPQPATR